jgi:hypothetical protein
MEHHAMNRQTGVEVQLHAFLSSILDGVEWSASWPGHFTTRYKARVITRQKAGSVPELVWTLWRIEKVYCLYQELNPDSLVAEPLV